MKPGNLSNDIEVDAGITCEIRQVDIPTKWYFQPGYTAQKRNLIHYTRGHRVLASTIAVCIFLLGAILGLCIADRRSPCERSSSASFSPAKSALSYEMLSKHATDHNAYSPYSGPPSAEQDRAWEHLVGPVMISASRKEMLLAGEAPQHSVQLSQGRGYLASLGVFHELHCLRRIRYFLYQDHYYPNITAEQHRHETKHIDHCLETLRLSSMCRADIGLYTFQWIPPNRTKPATKSNAARSCVKWDRLHAWASARSVGFNPILEAASP